MSPSGSIADPLRHTFESPPFDEAIVADAMRMGLLTCRPETPLREVARAIATNRVHAIVVADLDDGRPWGVITSLDLARAASAGFDELVAGQVAGTEGATVVADAPLDQAVRIMSEHDIDHLIAIQPQSGHPVGVLSTFDVAGVLAWGGAGA